MNIFNNNCNIIKNIVYLEGYNTILRKYCAKSEWKGVVGLEIHAQIDTVSKLFSGASTTFAERVNNNVSLFDAATPGTLPVLNRKCVESGVLTALALNCEISPVSLFDRKHYFYADLPAGYQITQQRKPLANNGFLQFDVYQPNIHKKPYKKTSRIKQIQLEQDSGKSLHDEEAQRSLVDLNRAGIPLMEIVFEPDLEDGEEAASLVKELILILRRLKTCSCKMEEGNLRVDANVSVHLPGSPLGIRSEVKNIGSIRGVANAINFEIKRQIQVLSSGDEVINETRNWNAEVGETVPMRDKEAKQDYRFMPEPNLPPLHINLSDKEINNKNIVSVNKIRGLIPELPEETRSRLIKMYNLLPQIAYLLVDEEILLSVFNNLIDKNERRNPKVVSNILINELLKLVNKGKITLEQCDTKLENSLGEIIDLIQGRKINLINARLLLEEIVEGNKESPSKIIEKRGWQMITEEEEIKKLCEDVIKNNPKLVAQYKNGKQKVYKAFLGEIVKTSQNKADMEIADKILKELLKK